MDLHKARRYQNNPPGIHTCERLRENRVDGDPQRMSYVGNDVATGQIRGDANLSVPPGE